MNHKEIRIRSATMQDTRELLDIYAPYIKNTAITFEYEVPSEQEFAERIRKIQRKFPYLVAERNGEILGYVYASAFHERAACAWAVETSIYVNQEKKGMGIGRKLYGVLEDALEKQGILNLNACIAYPDVEDEYLTMDSIHFHEHLGYRMVGGFHQCGHKFGRWYNLAWMEKHIGTRLEHQPKVRTFEEIEEEVFPWLRNYNR